MTLDEADQWVTTGTFYDNDYVQEHTHVPSDKSKIPFVIGLSGPSRSGTTAMLLLMASQPWIDYAYFQPQKSLIRKGRPDFVLHEEHKTIFTKEVFGMLYAQENFDPIGHLLKSGVPADKICWITILRDPRDTFASWRTMVNGTTPELYATAQAHTVDLYNMYKDTVMSIPFAYDLLSLGLDDVIAALSQKIPHSTGIHHELKPDVVRNKISLGQAADKGVYDRSVGVVIDEGKFVYVKSDKPLSDEDSSQIEDLCRQRYVDFYNESAAFLGLDS